MTAGEAQAQGLSEALGIIFRPPAKLTANRDERHHDDVSYWLEKTLDAVSKVAKDYHDAVDPDLFKEALLDAENAVEDRIFEYRKAWEAAKGREAGDYVDDDRR